MRAVLRGWLAALCLAVAAHAAEAPQSGEIAVPATAYLTAGGDVVQLGGAIAWRASDPASGASDAIAPALLCIFRAAATWLALRHGPDDLLLLHSGKPDAAGAALRDEFLGMVNDRGREFGIEVADAELTASVPGAAEGGVEAATLRAAQTVAAARADAAAMRAQAARAADAQRMAAAASSAENIAASRTLVAPILALQHRDGNAEPALLDQLYHDRIGAILAQAGSVTAIDAKAVSRVILPGAAPR